jgi:replicative DNA helicase
MAQSKVMQQVVPVVEQPLERRQPATPPEPKKRRRLPARRPRKGASEPLNPRELSSVLDDALARMQRRSKGEEKPIPLPWPGLVEALGGGLWGGTAVTMVGDTGCGKTQWALQVALNAAASGIPVCYVASEPGVEQVAPRLLAIKAGHRWNDLYVGKTDAATIDGIRSSYADALKELPFHLLPGTPSRPGEPGSRSVAEWMRERYKEKAPGRRPVLIVLDFVELVTGGRDQEDFNELMGRVAQEARLAAREHDAAVLIVSSTSREQRLNEDGSIGIHHERRQPRGLGRGNPARLLLTGKNAGDMERESDTVLVLAAEPEPRPAGITPDEERPWTRVWCAVAKNRSGSRAWCALRFNGSVYEEDVEATRALPAEACEAPEAPEED